MITIPDPVTYEWARGTTDRLVEACVAVEMTPDSKWRRAAALATAEEIGELLAAMDRMEPGDRLKYSQYLESIWPPPELMCSDCREQHAGHLHAKQDAMRTAIELMRQLAVASAHPGDDPDRVIADQASTVDRYLEKYADSDPGMTSVAVYLLARYLTQRAVIYMVVALADQLDRQPTESEMMAELDKGEWGALDRRDAAALTAVELTRQMVVASEYFGNDPGRGVNAQIDAVNRYVRKHAGAEPGPAGTANALHMLFHMLAHGATYSLIAALENFLGHPPTEAEMLAELDDDERQVLSFREDKD